MTSWRTRIEQSLIGRSLIGRALLERVPRDHTEPVQRFRRRRVVVAITLIVGATLLGVSLAIPPGNRSFYLSTIVTAMVWTVGGLLSGPLHLGCIQERGALRRPVVAPVTIGLLAGAVFLAGGLVVREIPVLRDYVQNVLAHANSGAVLPITVVTVANGVAEEIFFRGALFAAIGRRYPVLISTVIYGLATFATGNPMLVFAAIILGVLCGLQRRASGGVLAAILTHVTWSILMLFALPPLFGQ
jgi:membrane protease YdiL (CAAX protease family)